jgi:hypothetical protein
MGMFDYYQPQPEFRCPACSSPLRGWQGKDAACALFLWVQGQATPVDQVMDDEWKLPSAERAQHRLPERFEIYTSCETCKRWIDATGFVTDGIWSMSVLGRHGSSVAVRAVLLQDHWRQCLSCADAWEDGSRNVFSQCPSCKALTELDDFSKSRLVNGT